MGYWIIVILIVLGGVLVFIAATTVDPNGEALKQSARPEPIGPSAARRSARPRMSEPEVSLVVFTPQLWLHGDQSSLELDIPGVETELHPLRSSMLSDVAAAAESPAMILAGSIAMVLVGADDFLAGHSLDTVLHDLDQLLDYLANQPAMAVVGSVPALGTAIAETITGVSAESISATVALWNNAIANLVQSYSAGFVDLGSVPVQLVNAEGRVPGLTLSAAPDLTMMAAALTQACVRAADRVRSIRAET